MSAGATPKTNSNEGASGADWQRAARNAGALTLATILGKGGIFLWQLVLIAQLGEELYGIYGVVASSMALAAAFSTLGMGIIIARDVARVPGRAGEYWSAALAMQTALAALAYPLMILAAGLGEFEQQSLVQGYLALIGINLFLDCFGNIGNDLLLAQEKLRHTALVSVLHIAALVTLGGGALWLGYGLRGVYLGSIAASALRALALNAFVWRSGARPARFPFTTARRLFVSAAPIGLNGLLALGVTQVDKQITARYLGAESVGHLLAAALLIYGVIELLGTPQLTALFPLHARLQGDARAPQLPERMSYFMLLWTVPLAIAISAYAPALTRLLFRAEGFEQSGPILAILIWYAPLAITSDIFAQVLMMQNWQRRLLFIRAASLSLNIALNVALLTQWRDVRGVAIASVCAEAFVLTALVWQLRHYGIRWRRLARRVGRLGMAAITVAALFWLLRDGRAWLGVPLAIGGYALALWRGGLLNDEDRELLTILWRMLPRPGPFAQSTRA